MEPALIPLIVFVVLGLVIFPRSVVVVPADAAYVVERLGRYHATLVPGLHLLVPFIDTVRFRHRTDEQELPLESRDERTDDGVPLRVSAALRWKVTDAERASYSVADVATALRERALLAIRKEIGKAKLYDLLPERDGVGRRVAESLARAGADWGAEVVACEIRALEPPAAVVEAIAREADRERRERAKS
jgi:regulator of protease activity HflC (stomatin/prohibitin superfamily)